MFGKSAVNFREHYIIECYSGATQTLPKFIFSLFISADSLIYNFSINFREFAFLRVSYFSQFYTSRHQKSTSGRTSGVIFLNFKSPHGVEYAKEGHADIGEYSSPHVHNTQSP